MTANAQSLIEKNGNYSQFIELVGHMIAFHAHGLCIMSIDFNRLHLNTRKFSGIDSNYNFFQ